MRGRWRRIWFYPSPFGASDLGMRRTPWALMLGLGYILFIALMGGLTSDHVFIGSLALLDYYNQKSRLFLRLFFPFILTGMLYDLNRYFYWPAVDGRVHVAEPYFRDLYWFGVPTMIDGVVRILTPNEFLIRLTNTALDLLCGFAYLVFVGEYLAIAFFLFVRERLRLLWIFGWCFLSVNVLGYATYFIYPAAPPWYVEMYGLGPARMDVKPHAASAARFDALLGTNFFDEIYGRGIATYGAYPSLHVAYPLLVIWICYRCPQLWWARIPAICFYALMCFSAVYLQHHYVVDVLLGSIYAVLVIVAATYFTSPNMRKC